jgi:hypothetical protein
MSDQKQDKKYENFSLFCIPWERGDKPYFVNDIGSEWYLDKDVNEYIKKKGLGNIVGFLIKNNHEAIRILMTIDTNDIVHASTGYEDVLAKVEMLHIANVYNK